MKKIFLVAVLACFAFIGCEKPVDDPLNFSQSEKEALQVFSGTFKDDEVFDGEVISTEIFTFTPFDKFQLKTATFQYDDYSTYFSGTLYRDYYDSWTEIAIKGNYYFYISTDKKQLFIYEVHSSDPEKYAISTHAKIYDYRIVDTNTIALHDTGLASYLWGEYERQ